MPDPLCHTDDGRPPTAEGRMREAYAQGWDEDRESHASSDRQSFAALIIKHGAAAIEAALAEQRARIVAWLPSLVAQGATALQVLYELRQGKPEDWAERTGWKMEETGDANGAAS